MLTSWWRHKVEGTSYTHSAPHTLYLHLLSCARLYVRQSSLPSPNLRHVLSRYSEYLTVRSEARGPPTRAGTRTCTSAGRGPVHKALCGRTPSHTALAASRAASCGRHLRVGPLHPAGERLWGRGGAGAGWVREGREGGR